MNILSVLGISRKTTSPAPRPLARDDAEAEVQFETQLLALHSIIADAAIVASCVNYVAAGGSVETLVHARPHMLPANPDIDDRIASATRDTPQTVQSHLKSLRRNCSVATAATNELITTATTATALRPPRPALDACSSQWRALAQLAVDTINTLEPEARWRIAGRYSENALLLVRLLRSIRDGRWPCVSEIGSIEPVNLPQRRRVPRYELREKCHVIADGEAFDAVTVDISTGGLGLRSAHPFAMRQDVKIHLESGRRFHGVVAWIKSGRIGIQFLNELVSTDPLLGG